MNRDQITLAFMAAGMVAVAYHSDVTKTLRVLGRKLKLPKWLSFAKRPLNEIRIGEIVLDDEDRVRHTHIVGATGTGKTALVEQMIFADIKNGRGAFIIDGKGDREFYDRIKAFVKEIGREKDLHLISANHLAESACWNPCRLGDVAELQSKLLNPWVFSEPFYEKSCQHALLHSLNLAAESGKPFFLTQVRSGLSNAPVPKEHAQGLNLDFGNLMNSEWKEILMCAEASGPREEINFLDVIRRNEIVFLDLPSEGKAIQSKLVGKLFLQEIMLVSGLRKIYPALRSASPFMIYIDEFDAFATENFVTFLNKGRSSNFAIHMIHQTLSDLEKVSKEFLNQVLGNTNVRIVFRQDVPEDAETWSNFFGTGEKVKSTYRTSGGSETGEASNRVAKEFNIHPDLIKSLAVGECIFSAKTNRILSHVKVPLYKPSKFKGPLLRPAQPFKNRDLETDPKIKKSKET